MGFNSGFKGLIVPIFLHGCETWSLVWREEHRLRVLENRVLRRIFGHKEGESVRRMGEKIYNEELQDFCFLSHVSE